ncbi:hypothetical protein FRB98_003696 [Tulasnella sp. 332]|nr:hypothetical protein FRB98_003696 [Tulasnella sp. 332]
MEDDAVRAGEPSKVSTATRAAGVDNSSGSKDLALQNVYRIAVAYLYSDPFTLDDVDIGTLLENEWGAVDYPLEFRYRSDQLRDIIVSNPDLAKLVKTFRVTFWRHPINTELIVPRLTHIITANLETRPYPFLTLCPSTKLQNLYVEECKLPQTFAHWLAGQRDIRVLELKGVHFEPDCCPSVYLPKLEALSSPPETAKSILSQSPVLQYQTRITLRSLPKVFDLLHDHAPKITEIKIDLTTGLIPKPKVLPHLSVYACHLHVYFSLVHFAT